MNDLTHSTTDLTLKRNSQIARKCRLRHSKPKNPRNHHSRTEKPALAAN